MVGRGAKVRHRALVAPPRAYRPQGSYRDASERFAAGEGLRRHRSGVRSSARVDRGDPARSRWPSVRLSGPAPSALRRSTSVATPARAPPSSTWRSATSACSTSYPRPCAVTRV